MFGLSGFELAIIAVFGFLIFGPDKLPQIARTIGRVVRQFQNAQEQMNKVIKAEVYDPLKDLEPLANPFAGLSLDGSKESAKKAGSKTKKKSATSDTTKKAAAATDDKKADGGSAVALSETTQPKVSSAALKVALGEEAAKAKAQVKSTGDAAAKTSAATPATESFAQRRARLEKEHAKAKAAAASAETSTATPAKTVASATPAKTVAAAAPKTTSEKREEDEVGA